jgi:hypothetical protein
LKSLFNPWGYTSNLPPDKEILEEIAVEMANTNRSTK